MATPGAQTKSPLLSLSSIASISKTHPIIAKALQQIVDHINKNVTPKQGTKVQS